MMCIGSRVLHWRHRWQVRAWEHRLLHAALRLPPEECDGGGGARRFSDGGGDARRLSDASSVELLRGVPMRASGSAASAAGLESEQAFDDTGRGCWSPSVAPTQVHDGMSDG